MSGIFSNISGFFGLRFNSGQNGGYMPGGGCCNNNFGNIWGGNFGAMMPYNSYNMFNPFGFNNFGCSNFGSMFMQPFGGFNQFGSFNQFGGFGSFGNYGSQFGGYAQFGGCDYGNNGFGNFLGLLGAGILGYSLGKQKTDKAEETTEKSQSSGNVEQKNNAQAPAESKDAQANGQATNNKTDNSTNKASGNENKQNDNIISSVPNTELKPEVKAPTAGNNEVKSPAANKSKDETKIKSTDKANNSKKLEMTAAEKAKAKEKEAAEEQKELENYFKNRAKQLGIDVSKDNYETMRAKVLANNPDPKAAAIYKKNLEKANEGNNKTKQSTLELNLRMIPDMGYDKETKVENGVTTITGKYSNGYEYKVIQNADGSYVTYMDYDHDKKHGLDKDGWDIIIRRNKDGSGTVEKLYQDDTGYGTEITKYDNEQNNYNVTKTVKLTRPVATEIYTEYNDDNSYNKKTVIDAKGTTNYTWDKTKQEYIKQ